MVATLVLEASAVRRGGSSPPNPTVKEHGMARNVMVSVKPFDLIISHSNGKLLVSFHNSLPVRELADKLSMLSNYVKMCSSDKTVLDLEIEIQPKQD